MLLWNIRRDDAAPFMKAYNDFLLKFSTDYQKINLRRINEKTYNAFFNQNGFQNIAVKHYQVFDFEGLKGRYLSCSYAYDESHSEYLVAMKSLKRIFNTHQKNGHIRFEYNTQMFFGQL